MSGVTPVQSEATQWNCSGAIDVDKDGNVFVGYSNEHRIQKYSRDGTFVRELGNATNGYFEDLMSIVVDADSNVLTLDQPQQGFPRIQKWTPLKSAPWLFTFDDIQGAYLSRGADVECRNLFDADYRNFIYVCEYENISVYRQWFEWVPVEQDFTFEDADGDGLTDVQETEGWDITVTTEEVATSASRVMRSSGTSIKHVTGDPLNPDSDFDGVDDLNEYLFRSDPRSIDSDDDGLSDLDELHLLTNQTLTGWDSDGDGLGDGIELGFGSDPMDPDSDGDGLFDNQEFAIGSNPNRSDTDQDGLGDLNEVLYGADPNNPDPDGDMMLDWQEFALGTDPNSNDSDYDGIKDGLEVMYGTSPTFGDSDSDGLSDAFELSSLMNPLSNDTDGDGVSDSRELELGLNPRSRDSDGDGVPDSLDLDYQLTLDGEIVLCYDDIPGAAEFAANLSRQAVVRVVGPDELLRNHSGSRYIVLVGNPNGSDGTAGRVIGDLLQNSGDLLQLMKENIYNRMAVRYGAWNATQTIVMLSSVYDTDWIRAIGVLKSMRMTVTDRAVLVEYRNPRACFLLDQEDVLKTTDTYISTKLDSMATFNVNVEKLTDDEMTPSLETSDALWLGETIMNKYVGIEFLPDSSNSTTAPLGTQIRVYYTLADLDLNSDGDHTDDVDLNESCLGLFVLNDYGNWVRVSDIVILSGVNTSDLALFGKQYAGYVWAELQGSPSYFGIAGLTNWASHAPEPR